MSGQSEISIVLSRVREGDPAAMSELVALLYPELRRIARRHLRGERSGHSLQPTALVHEAYLRLAGEDGKPWQDREHFMAVAAKVMRHILVDHARNIGAQKRGAGIAHLALDEALVYSPEEASAFVDLDEALQHLEQADPIKARVVELRFYGGLSIEEIAASMNISPRTVKRYWNAARARLQQHFAAQKRHDHD